MKDFFDLLFASHVSPNGYLVLHMLHTDHNYPAYINHGTEQHRLVLSKHLTEVNYRDEDQVARHKFELTDLARHLLREVELLADSGAKRKKVAAIPFEAWEAQIKTYVKMFPPGNQGNAPIRSPAKTLHDRFKWFFLTFPEYSWDDVLEATESYLSNMENSAEGFKYISTSKYFIKKQENGGKTELSRLADYCLAVKDGTAQALASQQTLHIQSDVV